jgi:hypothetical protein
MARFLYTRSADADVCAPMPAEDCRVAAVLRPGWKMPEPPPGGPWRAVVHDTGDGWSPSWESDDDASVEDHLIVGDEGWPFLDDFAYPSDWTALGFEVV